MYIGECERKSYVGLPTLQGIGALSVSHHSSLIPGQYLGIHE